MMVNTSDDDDDDDNICLLSTWIMKNHSSHSEDVSGIMKWMWVELLTFIVS